MLTLVIQFHRERMLPRLNEFLFCLLNNLGNPNVKNVLNLYEESDDFLPDIVRRHPKYKASKIGCWLKFSDVFNFCNKHLQGEICALANLDIMLEKKVWDLSIITDKTVLALSRHEYDVETESAVLDENFSKILHAHTQDVWIFKAPILVNDCEFEMGLLGCDNAIAHRLVNSGYKVYNIPETYKVFHVDKVKGKNSQNFIKVHQDTTKAKIANKHPEKEGHYLLPNFDKVSGMSLDSIASAFNLTSFEKYELVCDLFTRKIQIQNPN